MEDGFLITTAENVSGYEAAQVHGEVFGLTVRSRNVGSDIGAELKALAGGELTGLTKVLVSAREQAVQRTKEQAQSVGANAVVMMRFDVGESRGIGTEACACGTAVSVVRK